MTPTRQANCLLQCSLVAASEASNCFQKSQLTYPERLCPLFHRLRLHGEVGRAQTLDAAPQINRRLGPAVNVPQVLPQQMAKLTGGLNLGIKLPGMP